MMTEEEGYLGQGRREDARKNRRNKTKKGTKKSEKVQFFSKCLISVCSISVTPVTERY